jgi:uncharacterized membrane protein (UPF0182 family)
MLFIFLTLFLAIFFLPQFISFYVDWLWFKDVGFEKIFTAKLNARQHRFAGIFAGFCYFCEHLVFDEGHKGQVYRPVPVCQDCRLDVLRLLTG